LEFPSFGWDTLNKGDIRKTEEVERRAMSKVLAYQGLKYEDRLKRHGCTYMEMRRK